MKQHVAIVVVGYKNSDDVSRCIKALTQSAYQDFEIVICENGGAPAHRALKSNLPSNLPNGQSITLIEAPNNGGYGSGVNISMAASSSADAWWILNPDTEPDPGALKALVARLNQGFHAVGGTLYFSNGRVQSHGGLWRPWLARAVSLGNGSSLDATVDVESVERNLSYLSGASMLVSRDFYKHAGQMSEDFFLYCEEIDWCLRARKCGLKLGFAAEAKVLHHQGTTTGNIQKLNDRSKLSVYLDERNKVLLTKKHFFGHLLVAAPAALVLMAMRYLRNGAVRQFGFGLSGWFAGLRGECGPPSSL